ncbi:PHD finger protein 20-like protein 1 isoform X4 [Coregonus clupeaformis]|uniref:PHD finger protein 20-like protein 1 isoform X4 n=1 Tax=Coregonus clupeaformis TaxID=59861 RepID=UPI001BDF86AD|nr:PHD finger protein 20-like protein 1 isoform X4 [Coregonus clupeaformis]
MCSQSCHRQTDHQSPDVVKMSKKVPYRPGITFEVGARIEAQDYLQKWYSSRIEDIDFDEGKMLVHFDRWSHRYDEWIAWDSTRLRPLERPTLRKEGLKEEEGEMTERLSEMSASRLDELPGCTESTEDQTELPQPRQELRDGEEVLARWTDCRYYPAKIESVNKEGTYTVQFYDGVIRCVKRIHIKSMPDDAKGQKDWIALVKAASAAAKGKGSSTPRTSANSNKDRDDLHGGKSDDEDGEEEMDEELQDQSDSDKLGSHEDDADCKKERTEVQVTSQQQKVPRTADCDSIQGQTQRETGSSMTGSPAKCRNRRLKHHSAESNSNQNQRPSRPPCSITTLSAGEDTMSAPESMLSPSPRHSCPDMATSGRSAEGQDHSGKRHGEAVPTGSPRSSEQIQRRRRSQRLATVSPDINSDSSVTSHPTTTQCPDPSPHGREHNTSHKDPSSTPEDQVANSVERAESSTLHNYCVGIPPKPPTTASILTPSHSPITHRDQLTDGPSANHTAVADKFPPLAAAPGRRTTRTPKLNKHTREPIMNTKRSDDPTSPNDLDHYKCKIPGCSKAFRKAKLLDYHLKYYHNADKDLQDSELTGSPDRAGRTRATSASMPTTTLLEVPDNAKRRRTVSTSSSLSPPGHMFQLDCTGLGGCLKPPKLNRKKRSSASMSSDSTELSLPPPPQEKSFESLHDKILKKVIDKDKHLEPGLMKIEKKVKLEEKCQMIGKKKDKDKERRKEKDHFKIKQKKKKKKKRKSKQHCYSDYDDMSLSFLERSTSSSLHRSSTSSFTFPSSSSSSTSRHYLYPRAILSVDLTGENLSDIDFLEDSTTESLLFSGDEYNQDFDSLNMEDFQEEDEDGTQEIVRCICEMDEENGFMIQCEECMCWQHSVCMGLLEDSIPDQYICYICRDPPGQRWSAKYLHDKDWLNKGHMYGLSFLSENYSQQNSKKTVSTHQLLADVFSVNNILHGLQLKMDILQNKHNPNLHFWARSWVNSDEDQPMGGLPDCIHFTDHLDDKSLDNQNSSKPDTYITSEHSYQKPPSPGQLEHRPAADPNSSNSQEGGGVGAELVVANANPASHSIQFKEEEKTTAVALPGCLDERGSDSVLDVPGCLDERGSDSVLAVPGCLDERGSDSVEHARNCLQWQMNLLTHIEDVQNQVAGRMDLIEKELDVLESWLDFTGELEPPDPLARLPQLKHRIKQLLTDLSKVQQMSTLCSV